MKPIVCAVTLAIVSPIALASPIALSTPGPYSISSLPTPVGSSSDAFGISASGVAGYISDSEGNTAYVMWTPGGIQSFEPFDVFASVGISSSNDNNVVVGGGYGFRQPPRGIKWVNGVGEALPVDDADDDETDFLYGSTARGVNNAGTIVGYGDTEYGSSGIVWHTDGDIELLHSINPTEGYDYAAAKDINNAGVVAGIATVGTPGGDIRHAVTWTDGVATDLGIFPGGSLSSANAINELGQVVGWGETGPNGGVAFISDGTPDSIVPLPNLAGYIYGEAFDVNNSGWAVGSCLPPGIEDNSRAALWIDGAVYDLNDLLPDKSNWELLSANGITDDGTIVGWGILDGQYVAFQMNVIPAPTTLMGFAGAAGLLAGRRRRS